MASRGKSSHCKSHRLMSISNDKCTNTGNSQTYHASYIQACMSTVCDQNRNFVSEICDPRKGSISVALSSPVFCSSPTGEEQGLISEQRLGIELNSRSEAKNFSSR